MSTSLTRIMVVSISLCWLLSAKTHLNDIVDPSVAEKLAHEAMLQEKAAKDEVKAPKKESQGKDIEIVLPLKTEDAKYVYVILGWIPYDFKEKFNLDFIDTNKEFIVNGALIYSKERKPLIPDNEYSASIWYLLNTDEMDNFHKIESSSYLSLIHI